MHVSPRETRENSLEKKQRRVIDISDPHTELWKSALVNRFSSRPNLCWTWRRSRLQVFIVGCTDSAIDLLRLAKCFSTAGNSRVLSLLNWKSYRKICSDSFVGGFPILSLTFRCKQSYRWLRCPFAEPTAYAAYRESKLSNSLWIRFAVKETGQRVNRGLLLRSEKFCILQAGSECKHRLRHRISRRCMLLWASPLKKRMRKDRRISIHLTPAIPFSTKTPGVYLDTQFTKAFPSDASHYQPKPLPYP